MEKIWLKNYPTDVPQTVNVDKYNSLGEMLEHYCRKFSKNAAFTNFEVTITYRQLEQLSRHFASYLQTELQMAKGDRFAIMLPNILQFPIALFGALRAGLIVVNINPLYTAREIEFQLKDSGATAIIVLENFAHELSLALPKTKVNRVIITRLGDCLGRIKGGLTNFVIKRIKRLIQPWEIPNGYYFKKALKLGRSHQFQKVAMNRYDIAFLQYTGGTTGTPKGAMLTHRNLLSNIAQSLSWVKSTLIPGEEVVLTALPLYHIFSLTICCLAFITLGSNCLLITNPRDLKGLIKAIHKIPPTFFVGINTLFNGLLHHPDFKRIMTSHLKYVISGGMAMQKPVAEEWQERTGRVVIEGYGLTEASPVVTINPFTLERFNGSAGLPVPNTEIKVCDANGDELSIGQSGELFVRGPQVMKGYWQKPEETVMVIDSEGWLRTGDIGRIDEQGFIYILDRKKDMILVSGFNVYPTEVEEIIASMPEVREVAVIGVPSEKTGEGIKAFIVKGDKALTAQRVIEYCRERLAAYKIPKKIEFREQLPKSAVGKVLRRALRYEEEFSQAPQH